VKSERTTDNGRWTADDGRQVMAKAYKIILILQLIITSLPSCLKISNVFFIVLTICPCICISIFLQFSLCLD